MTEIQTWTAWRGGAAGQGREGGVDRRCPACTTTTTAVACARTVQRRVGGLQPRHNAQTLQAVIPPFSPTHPSLSPAHAPHGNKPSPPPASVACSPAFLRRRCTRLTTSRARPAATRPSSDRRSITTSTSPSPAASMSSAAAAMVAGGSTSGWVGRSTGEEQAAGAGTTSTAVLAGDKAIGRGAITGGKKRWQRICRGRRGRHRQRAPVAQPTRLPAGSWKSRRTSILHAPTSPACPAADTMTAPFWCTAAFAGGDSGVRTQQRTHSWWGGEADGCGTHPACCLLVAGSHAGSSCLLAPSRSPRRSGCRRSHKPGCPVAGGTQNRKERGPYERESAACHIGHARLAPPLVSQDVLQHIWRNTT